MAQNFETSNIKLNKEEFLFLTVNIYDSRLELSIVTWNFSHVFDQEYFLRSPKHCGTCTKFFFGKSRPNLDSNFYFICFSKRLRKTKNLVCCRIKKLDNVVKAIQIGLILRSCFAEFCQRFSIAEILYVTRDRSFSFRQETLLTYG